VAAAPAADGGGQTAGQAPSASLRSAPPPRGEDHGRTRTLSPTHGLDGSWDRRLSHGLAAPDFTLDLHGHTLDQAHRRLDLGLAQAKAMGARVVLLVTGKPRPAQAADRGAQRGAIRAKVLDWLAAGPHGADVAAVRPAHRRHGGAGALYLVLRRRP
jgi:DNA-nicking Smr family endonuclease